MVLNQRSTLYQYSHYEALDQGCWDGELSIAELRQQGSLGLGTFNALDGELVVIDSQYYHCSQGNVRLAADDQLLPWAAVTFFESQHCFAIENVTSLDAFESLLLTQISSPNYPIALKIRAVVSNICIGSVPKQEKPYQTIPSIDNDFVPMHFGPMNVDMVGFYAPHFMFPIKSSGIHLHCADELRQIGGHVLSFDLLEGNVEVQELHKFNLVLPNMECYKTMSLSR